MLGEIHENLLGKYTGGGGGDAYSDMRDEDILARNPMPRPVP